MLKFEDIQRTVAKYGKEYGAQNIYLFGSYARGDASEHSNVNLRIDKGSIIGGIELAGLLLDIEGGTRCTSRFSHDRKPE